MSGHLAAAMQGKKCLDGNDKDFAEQRALALSCLEVVPETYRDCPCIEHPAEQQPCPLKYAAMTFCAVSTHFCGQPMLVWVLGFSVPLASQGSSGSVSAKTMFTSSLESQHCNKN